MNVKRDALVKEIPFWVLLSILLVALSLITIVPKIFFSFSTSDNRLAFLSAINGDVFVSDGIFDHAAQNGVLANRDGRTILRTEEGSVSVKLQDGSIVILDSKSMIEFNHPGMLTASDTFVFNLSHGKVLIINSQDSRSPTHVLIGGYFSATVFQSIVGLEILSTDGDRVKVDCLAGPCMIKSSIQLNTGQNAVIDKNESMQISLDVPYISWIALGKKGDYNARISSLFANLNPSPTNVIPQSATPSPTTAPTDTVSATPRKTLTPVATYTPTTSKTPTKTPPRWPIISRTSSPEPREDQVVPMTPTPLKTPTFTPLPSSTSWNTPTLAPTMIISPVPINTPTFAATHTNIPTATHTNIPTATQPEPTRTSRPTNTVRPSNTPAPSATLPPTSTPQPSATPEPTLTPQPSATPEPSATQEPTSEPSPTDDDDDDIEQNEGLPPT